MRERHAVSVDGYKGLWKHDDECLCLFASVFVPRHRYNEPALIGNRETGRDRDGNALVKSVAL